MTKNYNIGNIRGLSLCIQGTPHELISIIFFFRFIPVYTGNTQLRNISAFKRTVYPCVYREHTLDKYVKNTDCGLSLCIQGTPLIITAVSSVGRFIPVYTGNTCYIASSNVSKPVYPCVYREHIHRTPSSRRTRGLSLCIQGTPETLLGIYVNARFIPVYTGNTVGGEIPPIPTTVYPCVYREHSKYI